jgi:hypothetical protein
VNPVRNNAKHDENGGQYAGYEPQILSRKNYALSEQVILEMKWARLLSGRQAIRPEGECAYPHKCDDRINHLSSPIWSVLDYSPWRACHFGERRASSPKTIP